MEAPALELITPQNGCAHDAATKEELAQDGGTLKIFRY